MSMMGAMSTKFALHAGMLVFAARIEMHSIDAILDPSTPVSIASDDIIHRLDVDSGARDRQSIRKNRVIGIDHAEVRLRAIRAGKVDGAAMIVGSDVLRDVPLMLDFAHHRLRLPERREAHRLEASMTPVPAAISEDGCLSVAATDAGGEAILLALVGSEPAAGEAMPVKMGKLAAQASMDGSRCRANRATIGWEAFRGRRILIDVAAGKLWLGPPGSSS